VPSLHSTENKGNSYSCFGFPMLGPIVSIWKKEALFTKKKVAFTETTRSGPPSRERQPP
jgi:hypothetical protein